MEIQCPVHHKPLALKKEIIELFDKQISVITGKCEGCSCVYINYRLFSSTNVFTHNGIVYEFLDTLPIVSLPLTDKEEKAEHEVADTKKSKAVDKRLKANEGKRKKALEEKQQTEAYKLKLAEEKKQVKNEAINQTKNRILNDSYKEYRVKTIHYMDKPNKCHIDGDELLQVKRVSFEIEGIKFKTSAKCCLRCNSAYLSEKMKTNIESELEKAKNTKLNNIRAVNTPKKKPSVFDKQRQMDEQLENKEGPRPICIQQASKVPTEITSVTLKDGNGKEYTITIVYDEAYQRSNENIFWKDRGVSRSILRAISTGKPWVRYKERACMVVNYSFTELLSEMIGMEEGRDASSRPESIWVYKAKTPCPSHSSEVETVTAYVLSVQDGLYHPINVVYCKRCKKYYINATSFNIYSKKYGMPLIKLASSSGDGYGEYATWREESVLHFLGYNVNGMDNLSDVERHKILSQAMDAGHMQKAKVISFLETMIRLNEGQPKKANAVVKWKKDLKYVLDYKVEKQRKIYGAIRRRM